MATQQPFFVLSLINDGVDFYYTPSQEIGQRYGS